MNNRQPNPEDQRRLLTAFVLSMIVLTVFYIFFTKPRVEEMKRQAALQAENAATETVTAPELEPKTGQLVSVEEALSTTPRLAIETSKLTGSIPLVGNRIDDLRLKGYTQS